MTSPHPLIIDFKFEFLNNKGKSLSQDAMNDNADEIIDCLRTHTIPRYLSNNYKIDYLTSSLEFLSDKCEKTRFTTSIFRRLIYPFVRVSTDVNMELNNVLRTMFSEMFPKETPIQNVDNLICHDSNIEYYYSNFISMDENRIDQYMHQFCKGEKIEDHMEKINYSPVHFTESIREVLRVAILECPIPIIKNPETVTETRETPAVEIPLDTSIETDEESVILDDLESILKDPLVHAMISCTHRDVAAVFCKYNKHNIVVATENDSLVSFVFNEKTKLWNNCNGEVGQYIISEMIFKFMSKIVDTTIENKTEENTKYAADTKEFSRIIKEIKEWKKLHSKIGDRLYIVHIVGVTRGMLLNSATDSKAYKMNGNNNFELPLLNGKKINLKTLIVSDRTSDDLYTFECAVNYDSKCDPNSVDGANNFMLQVCNNDEELKEMVRLILGIFISGYNTKAIYYITGKGNNGKSLFINIISTILGGYAKVAPHRMLFKTKCEAAHNTEMSGMDHIRLTHISEIKKSDEINCETAKKISGDDVIDVRVAGASKSQAKVYKGLCILLAANNPVNFNFEDTAFIDRLIAIPFLNTFTPDSRIESKMLSQQMLDEVFFWICQGAKTYTNGDLKLKLSCTAIDKAKQELLSHNNKLEHFIQDELYIKPEKIRKEWEDYSLVGSGKNAKPSKQYDMFFRAKKTEVQKLYKAYIAHNPEALKQYREDIVTTLGKIYPLILSEGVQYFDGFALKHKVYIHSVEENGSEKEIHDLTELKYKFDAKNHKNTFTKVDLPNIIHLPSSSSVTR
jgi:P4 family phage/plasmid primase-like protien